MAVHKIDGVDGVANFPKKFVRLSLSIATSTTVTKGDFVSIDVGTSLIASYSNGLGAHCLTSNVTAQNEGLIFGVITETVTNSSSSAVLEQVVTIQTAGKFENANVASTVAAGDRLIATSTAGRCAEITTLAAASASFDFTVAAVALEAASTNQADVLIIDQGYF